MLYTFLSACILQILKIIVLILMILEETNRKVHAFNKHIDKTTLKPASKVYGNVIPRPIRLGAANFMVPCKNLKDL